MGKIRDTVEEEQVLFIQFITESRRRWDCGMSHKDEWASEGDLNPGLQILQDGQVGKTE